MQTGLWRFSSSYFLGSQLSILNKPKGVLVSPIQPGPGVTSQTPSSVKLRAPAAMKERGEIVVLLLRPAASCSRTPRCVCPYRASFRCRTASPLHDLYVECAWAPDGDGHGAQRTGVDAGNSALLMTDDSAPRKAGRTPSYLLHRSVSWSFPPALCPGASHHASLQSKTSVFSVTDPGERLEGLNLSLSFTVTDH